MHSPSSFNIKRLRFSWTRTWEEWDVQGGGSHGSIEAGAGDGFGADGGRPEFGPTARRPGRGPGAGAAVEHGRKRDVVLRLLQGEALHTLLILPVLSVAKSSR